jgi:hypothetical protein
MESSGKNRFVGLVRVVLLALGATAVFKELRKPAGQREWTGRVGPVPYDFRRPTLERIRSRLWSPEAPLVQPQPFGLGWTVNLGRLVAGLRSRT